MSGGAEQHSGDSKIFPDELEVSPELREASLRATEVSIREDQQSASDARSGTSRESLDAESQHEPVEPPRPEISASTTSIGAMGGATTPGRRDPLDDRDETMTTGASTISDVAKPGAAGPGQAEHTATTQRRSRATVAEPIVPGSGVPTSAAVRP